MCVSGFEFVEGGGKSEKPRLKFDMFVIPPPLSHLHVSMEPRERRQNDALNVCASAHAGLIFMCECS